MDLNSFAFRPPGALDEGEPLPAKNGHAFIVMELLEGEPLMQRMKRRGRMAEAEAAILMRAIADDKRAIIAYLKSLK